MRVVTVKPRYTLAMGVFAISLILYTTVVHAGPWSALSSGYAVTTNFQGIPVWPLPQDVTATAGTTEHPNANDGQGGRVPEFPDVTKVRFLWMPPEDSGLDEFLNPPELDPALDLTDSGEDYEDKDGNLWDIYTAEDTQSIEALGDWGVQAWFYDLEGNLKGKSGIEKIRATSFEAVPEVPFGTIVVFLAMIGALGVFAIKKKVRVPKT